MNDQPPVRAAAFTESDPPLGSCPEPAVTVRHIEVPAAIKAAVIDRIEAARNRDKNRF